MEVYMLPDLPKLMPISIAYYAVVNESIYPSGTSRKAKKEIRPINVTIVAPEKLKVCCNMLALPLPAEGSSRRMAVFLSTIAPTPSVHIDSPMPADMAATRRKPG